MIVIKDLSKTFRNNHVLKNLSLEIYDKEIFVILGQSGHGKSVLLKHIMGLMKPCSGTIHIDGIDMTTLAGTALYETLKNVGMIFQGCALFDSMTIEENVAFFLREHQIRGGKPIKSSEIKPLVDEALQKVGLEGTQHLYPSSLSGGMKKRAAIARGMIYQPKYLLYDEPTTGLDPVTAANIAKHIVKAQEDLQGTTIVVSHDIVTTLYIADRIALIEHGKIVALGTPIEFMKTSHPTIDLFNRMIGGDLNLIRKRN